jgi:hypothetical protein
MIANQAAGHIAIEHVETGARHHHRKFARTKFDIARTVDREQDIVAVPVDPWNSSRAAKE